MPFSRFVFLRCPSVSFAGGEDVNKGRMVVRSDGDGDGVGWDGWDGWDGELERAETESWREMRAGR